jgi:hypothetical protein
MPAFLKDFPATSLYHFPLFFSPQHFLPGFMSFHFALVFFLTLHSSISFKLL